MTQSPHMNSSTNCTELPCSADEIRKLIADAVNNEDAGDATWILTSAFIVFTMQSGFGLLEAGTCSSKNECNIMVKNAVDVLFGGLGYWLCGFGLSFGQGEYTNGFVGVGDFLTDSTADDMGHLFARYFFQLSFATTATTIVSGAMAERTNLKAYMLFSFLNMMSYVFPAHWIWDKDGFLMKMGVVDIAGCGPVHIVGGTSSLVATLMLKPRYKRFSKGYEKEYRMASPTNVILGTFMLWWGWLGFNCGSTFGVSGAKWQLASRAAVITINGSVGGGLFGIFYCYVLTNKYEKKLDIGVFSSCILSGLVSITSICVLCRPWEALVIGIIGAAICCYGSVLLSALKIDDPVTCISIHGFVGIWGLLVVGLFAEIDLSSESTNKNYGLFKGGGIKLLACQALALICICAWATVTTACELFIADKIIGIRMSLKDEKVGADFAEHGIGTGNQIEPLPPRQSSLIFGKRSRTGGSISPNYARRRKYAAKKHVSRNEKSEKSFSFSHEEATTGNHVMSRQNSQKIIKSLSNNVGIVNFGFLAISDNSLNKKIIVPSVTVETDKETAVRKSKMSTDEESGLRDKSE